MTDKKQISNLLVIIILAGISLTWVLPQKRLAFAATGEGGSGVDGTVDCTITPDDPSCKMDCTKNPDDILCEVDCTTNPDDPLCKPPSPSPELTNSTSVAPQAIEGFSTYEDPASLFTIQYPSAWEILTRKVGDVTFTSPFDFESGKQMSTVIILASDTKATTLGQLISEDKFGLEHNPLVKSKVFDESQATLSGLPAYKIVTDSALSSTSVQFNAVDIITLKNSKEYKISYNLGEPHDLPIIQQMIDSFQIK